MPMPTLPEPAHHDAQTLAHTSPKPTSHDDIATNMLARTSLRQISLAAKPSARRYTSSIKEGSVAASREFGKKEKAHEDQYIKQTERRKLEKLKAEMEKKKAELVRSVQSPPLLGDRPVRCDTYPIFQAELQKRHDEISSN
ncbi:hypothetical protein F5148DRAFT_1172797 [Russula earlei]|uniref:Uncharacterized protein n=1 Tax=Russula earlei TaxID=71964 RepID=A0ACC0UHN0_9AGAM|nr:hypothetical protein F5148DRAFT_1172797 [Russula earlei]